MIIYYLSVFVSQEFRQCTVGMDCLCSMVSVKGLEGWDRNHSPPCLDVDFLLGALVLPRAICLCQLLWASSQHGGGVQTVGTHREQGRQKLCTLLWPSSGSPVAPFLSGSRGGECVGLEILLRLILENALCHRAQTRSWVPPFFPP